MKYHIKRGENSLVKVVKWFKPTRTSGFEKAKSVKANISTMLKNLPKNWSDCKKLGRVRKQAQALANISKDKPTEKRAQQVANEASRRYKMKACLIPRK